MVILSLDLTSVWFMVGFSVGGVLSTVKLSVVWAGLPALSVAVMRMLCDPSVAWGTAYLSIHELVDCFFSFRVSPNIDAVTFSASELVVTVMVIILPVRTSSGVNVASICGGVLSMVRESVVFFCVPLLSVAVSSTGYVPSGVLGMV